MSSAFRPKPALPRAGGVRKHFSSICGLPFQAAILAGVVGFTLAMVGGNFLVAAHRSAQANDAKSALQRHGASIAREIGRALDSGDDIQAATLARRSLKAYPDTDIFVVNQTGEVLLDTPTGLPAPHLKEVQSIGENAFTGWVGEGQYLEIKLPVRGRLLPLGTLHLRQPLHVPAWMASIKVYATWACLGSAILTFLYLSYMLRGMVGLHKVLERASYGDFYARAPQVGAFEVRRVIQRTHEALVCMAAAADETRKVYVETALALSKTIEAKDRYTSGHNQRVAVFAVELAEKIGFSEERLETLRLGALLHDIGKVAVPDNVLLKPGFLNDEEFAVMKRHPMAGDRILAAIPGLRDMADIARSHHEKWDGSGYPLGVAGDSIPLEGRICAIADAYDALTTKRSYKSAMPLEQALDIIEKDAGTHFDPELAKIFVAMKRNGVGYKALKKPECKEVVAETSAEKEIQAAKEA